MSACDMTSFNGWMFDGFAVRRHESPFKGLKVLFVDNVEGKVK